MNIYKDFLFQLVQYKCNSLSATKKIYPPPFYWCILIQNCTYLLYIFWWIWAYSYTCDTSTKIKVINIAINSKIFLMSLFFQCVGGCKLTTYTPYSHSMSISFSRLFIMLIAWYIYLHLSRRVIFFLIFICIKIWIIVNTLLVFLQCIKAICLG